MVVPVYRIDYKGETEKLLKRTLLLRNRYGNKYELNNAEGVPQAIHDTLNLNQSVPGLGHQIALSAPLCIYREVKYTVLVSFKDLFKVYLLTYKIRCTQCTSCFFARFQLSR